MRITFTTEHKILPGFEVPMSIEQLKELASNREKPRDTLIAYIEPQQEWYVDEVDRIPLGISDWLNKHQLTNVELTSVCARTHVWTDVRKTPDGQVISKSDPMERMYVHYISIAANSISGKNSVKVKIVMGGSYTATITDSTAVIDSDNGIRAMWLKLIQDGVYKWFLVKVADEGYRTIPDNCIVANLAERPKWPTKSTDTRIYRDLRRRLAPMYEYNLYAPTVNKSPEEIVLSRQISTLGKHIADLFAKYREGNVCVPLSFWDVYQTMHAEADKGIDKNNEQAINHVFQTELVNNCIRLVSEEYERELFRRQTAKAARRAKLLASIAD